jgi:large subunit ribosomal protein L18
MANKKTYTVPFRRKREGKTNYKKRLALLKSKSLRLVVRKSNKHILVQLIEYTDTGDKVSLAVSSKHLLEFGWNKATGNIPAAYLTGVLLGNKAKGKKAILDLGLQTPISGSRLFAVLKGVLDGGLNINVNESVFPSEDRIMGKHIEKDYDKLVIKVKDKITAVKK